MNDKYSLDRVYEELAVVAIDSSYSLRELQLKLIHGGQQQLIAHYDVD